MEDFYGTLPGKEKENPLLKLAGILSENHPAVMEELEVCVRDTRVYYRKRIGKDGVRGGLGGQAEEQEMKRDGSGELSGADCACVQWLVMADSLMEHKIAAALDWKCELEDFAYCVKDLQGKKKYKLTFRSAWFDGEDSIEEWGRILNAKWGKGSPCLAQGACLVQLDINSDSYVILPVPNVLLKEAEELAKAAGQNLSPVGAEEREGAPDALDAFLRKHPWKRLENEDGLLPDSCVKCFASDAVPGGAVYCYCRAGDCFRVVIKSGRLSSGQILAIHRPFRLGAMEIRNRLAAGKEIYVKMKLRDTLMLMELLKEQQIAYEILPKAPDFPHFYDCPKRFLPSGGNDWQYHGFDREREMEWADEK